MYMFMCICMYIYIYTNIFVYSKSPVCHNQLRVSLSFLFAHYSSLLIDIKNKLETISRSPFQILVDPACGPGLWTHWPMGPACGPSPENLKIELRGLRLRLRYDNRLCDDFEQGVRLGLLEWLTKTSQSRFSYRKRSRKS